MTFQFTPLREGRPAAGSMTTCIFYFNSRPCGRGDCGNVGKGRDHDISIHAPAGGATDARKLEPVTLDLFQFTPLREGRLADGGRLIIAVDISIHAPAGGATRLF